jgi:maleate isomerase
VPPNSAIRALADDHAHLTTTAHIGVLVPWANTIVETELARMGLDRIVFHYARLVPERRYRDADAFLGEIAAAVPGALGQFARLSQLGTLAGALVGCTSVGFTTPQVYADSPVVDAFESIVSTLARVGTARIVLAAPYPKHHTAQEAETLTARGVTVLDHASLDLGLLDDFTAATPAHIRALVNTVEPQALADAEAVVLSCTAWPTLDAIGELEDAFGIPVISSNLALAMRAVRIALDAEV